MEDFVKKFFDLPVLILLLLLLYAFASRRVAPSTANVAATPVHSSLAVAGRACRVTAPRLNVRSSPDGQIIRILKHDDAVTNKGWEGSWIKTEIGYVHGQYVSC